MISMLTLMTILLFPADEAQSKTKTKLRVF